MKKNLLIACLLMFSLIAFSQSRLAIEPEGKAMRMVVNKGTIVPSNPIANSAATPLPIWSDDFSSAVNWEIGHDQTACALDWQIGLNSCQGSYQINDIESTTASNGWAMIDSDAYGGATGGTEVEDSWLTMATPVDLNGYADVNVEFETNYQSYNAELPYIVVGIGDGSGNVTWPDLDPTTDISTMTNVFIPFAGYASGDATDNPELISVNISSALVGLNPTELADIYIRFNWTGTWGYAWFVDDFAIVETPDNSIVTNNEVIGGFWIDYANYSGTGLNDIIGLDYTVTPLSQLANHPYVFESFVKNKGLSQQHVILNYSVTGAGTASGASSLIVLNSLEDSAFTTPSFSPTVLGDYSVDIWAEGDSSGAGVTITNSDMVTKNIEVTDYIYGKDLNGIDGIGGYILGGVEDQNHISTRYEMYADEQLMGLRAYISDRSNVGAEVKAVLYELDSTATEPIFLAESDNYILTAQDIGNWVNIPFGSGIDLYNGYAYEFGIAGFIHPTDSAYIGTSGKSLYNGEHSSFDELGLSTQSAGTPTWYYITSTPMVRMSFDPSIISAVSDDLKQTIFTAYPNPSNGVFTVELVEAANYDLVVSNVLGQIVFSKTVNGMSTSIDLSSFDKGIYTIELKDDNVIYTEKIIVE